MEECLKRNLDTGGAWLSSARAVNILRLAQRNFARKLSSNGGA